MKNKALGAFINYYCQMDYANRECKELVAGLCRSFGMALIGCFVYFRKSILPDLFFTTVVSLRGGKVNWYGMVDMPDGVVVV